MRPHKITLTGNGATTLNSEPVPVSWRANPTSISLYFDTDGNTTAFTVQYTGEDPNDYASATLYNANAKWFNHAFMAAMTADQTGNFAYPVRAIRMQADGSGTDTATLIIIQSGVGD